MLDTRTDTPDPVRRTLVTVPQDQRLEDRSWFVTLSHGFQTVRSRARPVHGGVVVVVVVVVDDVLYDVYGVVSLSQVIAIVYISVQ